MPDHNEMKQAMLTPLDSRVNRRSKDSVFCDLFSRPAYVLQLYQVLHPEDTDVTADDITLVTLGSLMTQTRYNDLGILIRDRLLVLVEAQSTFTENILTRFLLYLAETYNRYITRMSLNIYGTATVRLPAPELYVIYHGDRLGRPDEIRLSQSVFQLPRSQDAFLEVRARVIYDSREGDILHQYVTFARVFDAQVRHYGYTRQAVEETLRICRDDDILKAYLAEEEVANIMFTLLDEQKARELWARELQQASHAEGRAEGKAEGRAEGKAEGRAEGKAQGKEEERVTLIGTLMKSMSWTVQEAMDALRIPAAEQSRLASLVQDRA